jgi:long-chain acyl-CoA synthetase
MKTIPELFKESVAKYGNNILIYEKQNGSYKGFTYKEIDQQVKTLAAGLYKHGLRKGDRVALLAEGRTEWLVSELAMLHLGIIDVPLSVKLIEPSEIAFRINHSESKAIIVSGRQVDKIRGILNQMPKVETVIVFDEVDKKEKEIFYSEIVEAGKNAGEEIIKEVKKINSSIKGDDTANISYTSGTTADPKGIMLTHRNYTANTNRALHFSTSKRSLLPCLFFPGIIRLPTP